MTDAKYVKKAPRQSNLELSRILAMYLIVMHHFSVHGGVPIWSGSAPLSFNFYLDQLLSTGGKIGVNLFVLITGYFLAKKFSKFSSLIYRDARLVEGWPMHEIPKEQVRRGDALYFPGHIALYLGEGRYIHSTGAAGSGGVVLNSLDPADPLYREDLVKCLNAVGSIF